MSQYPRRLEQILADYDMYSIAEKTIMANKKAAREEILEIMKTSNVDFLDADNWSVVRKLRERKTFDSSLLIRKLGNETLDKYKKVSTYYTLEVTKGGDK